jgi:predicted ArsR family transcriptional regulator
MRFRVKPDKTGVLLALAAACWTVGAAAQPMEEAMQVTDAKDQAARQTQQQIDRIVSETDELTSEYVAASKEVDGLEVYNRLLEKQIEDQQRELSELAESMEEVTKTERQVTPLMVRMIDALESFVEMDLPFLLEERKKRVETLREMMQRADVSVAEKMRRVLEAYQIENEYGRSIEAYKGTLEVDGEERQVDFLRIGRIGLYFQTEDSERTGRWNPREGGWEDLGRDARRAVRDGLRIAREQIAPDLLMVELPAPGEGAR